MAQQTYLWRSGSRIALDAQKAGKELARIERSSGILTPELVLERAALTTNPLHTHFEWDDSKAGHAYRLTQAGELIRSITVETSRSNVLPSQPVRAFVNVEEAGSRHYTGTARAMGSKELRAQVLAKAWRDLEAWRQRYAELSELSRIFEAIDQARDAKPAAKAAA